MPTYEYRCTSCGNAVEVFQRIGEDPLTVCGICGGPLRKVFHPAGIVFKGSGFYATDSRSGDKGKASGDGKSGEGTSKKSEKAGSEKGRTEKGSGSSSESKEKSS